MGINHNSNQGEDIEDNENGIELTSPNRRIRRRTSSDNNERKSSLSDSFQSQDGEEDDDDYDHDSAEEDEVLGLMNRKHYNNEEEKDVEVSINARSIDYDSAASIVQSIVPEKDDPSLPALTFRVLLLGSLLCILGASVSQLFFFKSNAPSFSSFFIILISFPLGKLLASTLPPIECCLFGQTFNLNPGPFSKKEHLLVSKLWFSNTVVNCD